MEVPELHWKYELDIPLDTDERIMIESLKEKTSEKDSISELHI